MKNRAVRLGLYIAVLGIVFPDVTGYNHGDIRGLVLYAVGGVIFIMAEWKTL